MGSVEYFFYGKCERYVTINKKGFWIWNSLKKKMQKL